MTWFSFPAPKQATSTPGLGSSLPSLDANKAVWLPNISIKAYKNLNEPNGDVTFSPEFAGKSGVVWI